MANVRIDGLSDLGTRVKAMVTEARKAAGQALRKGAEILKDEAKGRAPRAASHKARAGVSSRHLADALTTKVSAGKYTAGVTVEGGANGPSYYWRFPEYGTTKQREQAFIRDSTESRGREAMDTVEREIKTKLGLK